MPLVLGFSLMANANDSKMKMEHKIDSKKSKATWTGKKVTGQRVGTVDIKSGSLKYDGSNLIG